MPLDQPKERLLEPYGMQTVYALKANFRRERELSEEREREKCEEYL